MVLGGDGRWYNKEAAQIIIKLAAGNGVAKMYVGRDGFLCTPAASAVIRARKASGGFIMSASHNPGGPENDWGIKFNASNGEPAPEKLTDAIYGFTQSVSVLKFGDIPDVDLSKVGVTRFGSFEVEVIDPVADYLALFKASDGPRMRLRCEPRFLTLPSHAFSSLRTKCLTSPCCAPSCRARTSRSASTACTPSPARTPSPSWWTRWAPRVTAW
jgi:hypothetical protein